MHNDDIMQELRKYRGMTTLVGLCSALTVLSDVFILRLSFPLQIIFGICALCFLVCCFRMYDKLAKKRPPGEKNRYKTISRCLLILLVGITMILSCLIPVMPSGIKAAVLSVGCIFILRLPTHKFLPKSTNREEHK